MRLPEATGCGFARYNHTLRAGHPVAFFCAHHPVDPSTVTGDFMFWTILASILTATALILVTLVVLAGLMDHLERQEEIKRRMINRKIDERTARNRADGEVQGRLMRS